MRGMQLLLTGVLIGGFATFGWVNAQSNSGSGELTGGDLAEIHQLYSHYNQGTDFGDADRWLSAFTEDAIFRIGANQEYNGRAAMIEWRRQSFASREGREYHYRHWNSSWIITPDGPDRATGKVYWMGFDPTAEELSIRDTGFYEDIYVRTPDGWRIKQRHANPDPRPSRARAD